MPQTNKHWYALYTAPRAEKKVSERFDQAGIEHYLPLHKVKRRWSDRIKEVIVPVVHGYIFVRITKTEFRTVMNIYGAIAFIKEFGKPVPIPDEQIKRLRFMVDLSEDTVEITTDDILPGQSIIVSRGPLQGLMGELVQIRGKHKVLIRLEKIGCALTTIPLSFITKV
jgi:transcription antitermination factor NusG